MSYLSQKWVAIDRRPMVTDTVIALVLLSLALLELRLMYPIFEEQPLAVRDEQIGPFYSVLMVCALYLPLIWRRRFPIAVLLLALSVFVPYRLLEVPEVRFSGNLMLFVLASGAAFSDSRWRAPVIALFFAVIIAMFVRALILTDLSQFPGNIALLQVLSALGNVFYFGFALWFGLALRSRRLRQADLMERTVQLEEQREENARRAVVDERVRIARELHDVVAHHVSVMGVQAGAARSVLDKSPEKAIEALSQIETSSRQAVVELQRLLGFLRHNDEQDKLTPQPTLDQLNSLVNEMREAGLPVNLEIRGEESTLTAGVALSAYRIVQEALTNTLRHAAKPVAASVTVGYLGDHLELEIVDDGKGLVSAVDSTAGNGLLGMRERVGLHGGDIDYGSGPYGGFYVRARLPVNGRTP